MADTVTEHPQYWASPFRTLDASFNPNDLHGIEQAMHAQIDDIIQMKRPDKQAGYAPHIYQYVLDGYRVFGACYIVGSLSEEMTSREGFRELPSQRPVEYQMIYQDEPTQREYELSATYIDQHAAKTSGYVHHLYQYRVRQGGRQFGSPVPIDCYVVATCCVAGDMPDDITSARDFKEIPWPTKQS